MRKLILSAFLVAVASGAYVALRVRGGGEVQAGVPTATAALRTLESRVLATGAVRLSVGAEVKVGSRVSGLLQKLNVSVGRRVARDQVIAELDEAEPAARVRQAETAVAVEERALANATRTHARARELFEQGTGSREIEEDSKGVLELSEARLQKARADLDLARVQLSYCTIRAPISGVVASVSTQEGEAIAAGLSAPTFVTIIDQKALEAVAFVDETDIGRVSPGRPARFSVDSFPDREFLGTVLSISPKAVILSGVVNYEVRIGVTDATGLKPDMTANVVLPTETRRGLAVPAPAVKRAEGERYVLVKSGERFARRNVRTGARDDRFVEIVEGLREGDTVATGDVPVTLLAAREKP